MDTVNTINPTPAPVPVPENESKPKKGFPLLPILIGGGVLLIAAIVALVIWLVGSDSYQFGVPEPNDIRWTFTEDDELVFLFNGEKTVKFGNKGTILNLQTNYNQQYVILLTKGESNSDEYNSGDLYIVNQEKYVKVASDVNYFAISSFGDTYFYEVDNELYCGQMGSPKQFIKIDSDVDRVECVSPDGNTVVYTKSMEAHEGEDQEDRTVYYISQSGAKGTRYAKQGVRIVAISNDAAFVYYAKDGKFYVNDTKLADLERLHNVVNFNQDGSQILYSATNNDGKAKLYISDHGTEKYALANGTLLSVLAPKGSYRYLFNDNLMSAYVNVETFAQTVAKVQGLDDFGDSKAIYYCIKSTRQEAEKNSTLTYSNEDMILLRNGRTALYTQFGSFYSCQINQPSSDQLMFPFDENDVESFQCTPDGECIYLLDEESTLYYVNSPKKFTKIKYDVITYAVAGDGSVYFITGDHELFWATPNGKCEKIASEVNPSTLEGNTYTDVTTVKIDGKYGVLEDGKFRKLFDLD